MKKKRSLILLGSMVLLLMLAALPFTAACAPSAPAGPVTLTAVQFLPKGNVTMEGFVVFVNMVNEAMKGKLQIEVKGGPEVTSAREQPEAVRSGAVDIAVVPASYYKAIVPVAGAMNLSKLTQFEEDKSGFTKYFQEAHEAGGLHFLAKGEWTEPYHLYSKTRITNQDGLKGKKWRHAASYPFFDALGLVPVTMNHPDVYAGLERGLIEGTIIKNSAYHQMKWYEVAPYIIGPGFWSMGGTTIIMNLDSYNALPKNVQKLLDETAQKARQPMGDRISALSVQQIVDLKAVGAEFVEWSPADSQRFLDTITLATWKVHEKKLGADGVATLKSLIGY